MTLFWIAVLGGAFLALLGGGSRRYHHHYYHQPDIDPAAAADGYDNGCDCDSDCN
jgi:hypothetical protein